MITDDQFAAWMKTDAARVLLAHVKYCTEEGSPLGPVEGTLYFASEEYRTEATDDPPNQPYFARIIGTPGFARNLDVNTLGGRATFSVSDLQLSNLDGELDYLLDLVVDGYKVEYYLGSPDWARSDFRLVLVVFQERIIAPDEMTINIKLRDRRLLLDREIKGDAIGGTGPNATKYLPILFGSNENIDISGNLYDEDDVIYSVLSNYMPGNYLLSRMMAMRDDGFPLRRDAVEWSAADTTVNIGTGVVTHLNHRLQIDDVVFFAGSGGFFVGDPSLHSSVPHLPPFDGYPLSPNNGSVWVTSANHDTGELTFSLTKGGAAIIPTGAIFNPIHPGFTLLMYQQGFFDTISVDGRVQLSRPPVGRLTCDVYNFGYISDTFSVPEDRPFYLAAGLMVRWGGLSESDDFELIASDSYSQVDNALDNKVAMGYTSLAVLDRQNLITVLNDILDSAFGWFGQENLGKVVFGMVDPSGIATATPTRTLDAWECETALSCENIAPTIDSANVSYRPNRSPQPDGLDRLLSETLRTKYSAPYGAVQLSTPPSGTEYATNKPLYHKTMTPGAPQFASMNDLTFGYPSFGVTPVSLLGYADEIVQDRLPHLKVLKTVASLDKYDWRLGEVILLTHPRFGFDAGRNVRLIGITVDFLSVERPVELTLLTQVTPDLTDVSRN